MALLTFHVTCVCVSVFFTFSVVGFAFSRVFTSTVDFKLTVPHQCSRLLCPPSRK